MVISQETKIKLFEEALRLYHLAEETTYDGRDYFEQSEGAFKMLTIMGLDHEYIRWSVGK